MTTINGNTGIDRVNDGSITQADLAPNVAGNGPCFMSINAATQTGFGPTLAVVELASELFDTDSSFAANIFAPKVAGYYQFNASITWGSGLPNPSGATLALLKNSALYGKASYTVITTGYELTQTLTCFVPLVVGDIVNLGGSVTAGSGRLNSAQFSGFLARAA